MPMKFELTPIGREEAETGSLASLSPTPDGYRTYKIVLELYYHGPLSLRELEHRTLIPEDFIRSKIDELSENSYVIGIDQPN